MKRLYYVLMLILLSFALVSCGYDNNAKVTNIQEGMVIEFHTEVQKQALEGDPNLITTYAKGGKELSIPEAINIEFSSESTNNQVHLSLDKDMKNKITYLLNNGEKALNVYNLEANSTYYCQINGGPIISFKTASGMRNLYIDGLTNCRDIGGYQIEGGFVKQGMMIRTSKLNNDYTGEVLITNEGIEAIKRLNIKTELDLRADTTSSKGVEQGGITKSAVSGVKYISFPMASGGNYLKINKEVLKDLFKILADESNYPILFHCSIGTDRTGVVSFLINALLGVSTEDLYRDYLFSNFGVIGSMRSASTLTDYINIVTTDSTKSLQENVRMFLLGEGVSQEDIDSVIRIMKSGL